MKQKLSIIILTLLLISATLTGCTVSQQNPQASLAQTLQPTSAPSQQGALPPVDYNIPNEPMRGSGIVVYDDTMLMENNNGIIVCGLDGKDGKVLKAGQDPSTLFYLMSYSDGWIYYVLGSGIYRIRPDGQDKTKLCGIKTNDADPNYLFGPNIAIKDSLYYVTVDDNYPSNSFYRVNGKGEKWLFEGISYRRPSFTIYKGTVYYSKRDGEVMRYDLRSGETNKLLDYGGYFFSVINDVLYYLDEDNYICTLDLISKEIIKLPEKIDDIVHYSVQFHNYLIYFCSIGIVEFNIDTKRIYSISPDYADEWEIYATNDSIYMVLDRDMVYKLSIEDGKAEIEPMKALNKALESLLWS